ncbi:MAG: AmmeMemoRadiSam system protein A [Chloroflexota bacterium]
MIPEPLNAEDRRFLLALARQSLEAGVRGQALPTLNLPSLSPALKAHGASFVTLTKRGELRGCIGALEAYQALAEDVREHAVAAALEDYRFSPVQPAELGDIHIEISRLTAPQPLAYSDADDLLRKLRPGVDGVLLREGVRRATFLPQVWEKIPDPATFLSHLCEKMGVHARQWQYKKLDVLTYRVEGFQE